MRFKRNLPACRGWTVVWCLLLTFTALAAQARDLRFEAILVWATSAEKSPDPNHKPLNPEVRRKLRDLPLKWANYFEVNRKSFTVSRHVAERVTLSAKCAIEVSDVDGKHIEVSLIGKGEPVLKRIQMLTKGQMLVLGGNAPDETGWLVVLKRMD